jgi:hypothetical protein
MLTVWLQDKLQTLQLKETLFAAGFATQEVSVILPTSSEVASKETDVVAVKLGTRHYPFSQDKYGLTVKTQTLLDEDLAKAVFRDCGVKTEKIKA